MPGSPVPSSENDLIPWLNNFKTKLPNYYGTLALDADDSGSIQQDLTCMIWLLTDYAPHLRRSLAAAVEFKNLMKDGEASAKLPEILPGTNPPASFGGLVPKPGIMTRLRKAVQNIKTRQGYTDAIGEDLDIVTHESDSGPEAPTLALTSFQAGSVTINWNKSGWTGIKMQSRSQGGAWTDLVMNLHSPFVDSRLLAVPGQAEVREYRASYLDGDTVHGIWSQTLAVTVLP